MGDRAKYARSIIGISFTAFLVIFAFSYFAGSMTRGFALISEDGTAERWVMDPEVESAELIINMPDSAWEQVPGVDGVCHQITSAIN